MYEHPIKGGLVILLVVSCKGNRDKLLLAGPLGSSTVHLTFKDLFASIYVLS